MNIPFVPTIYEHCAALIGKTPSQVAQSQELLVSAQLKACALYQPRLLSVGLDIYNIEAEALGARIIYPPNDDLPALQGPLIQNDSDFSSLKLPDPEKDGRMPLLLSACEKIKEKAAVPVSGTIAGPFTLAAILRGFEQFTLDCIDRPDFARQQLEFAKNVGLAFARAYLARKVGVTINESWITPPLCSPAFYRTVVQPVEKRLIAELKALGFQSIALICGGNTGPIVPDILDTGTSLIMADWGCDRLYFKELCRARNVILRACIAPAIVQAGDPHVMAGHAHAVIADCRDYPKFIFGCGIVSYDTPPEHVLKLKEIVERYTTASGLM